ncbi:hypothetical protein [Bifidobacterium aquikefiri]|uniref:hypothetical protein n=1 Tax=Bifidobacterium aquikefiri TaxID=1653207 RepID=UPI0023F344F0|nr:hypothetical protein [Bifidobacterium aquikefiri]
MSELFLFVTMAIPKAGAEIGRLPLTLNLILFALILVFNKNQAVLTVQSFREFGWRYLVVCFSILITITLGISVGASAFGISQMVVVLVLPLASVAVRQVSPLTFYQIVCAAVLIVNLYGLVQFAFGISKAAIPDIPNLRMFFIFVMAAVEYASPTTVMHAVRGAVSSANTLEVPGNVYV